jgi:predicted nucleic acid-binding protein
MLVICDTSPICYLVLIDEIDILAQLYHQVLIPQVVQEELSHKKSPDLVRNWINDSPGWLIIKNIDISGSPDLEVLDPGETAAILLAKKENANLIIIDDGLGRKIASERGLKVTGLLGVLEQAASQNLIDLPDVISRLQKTSFRASASLLNSLLKRHSY